MRSLNPWVRFAFGNVLQLDLNLDCPSSKYLSPPFAKKLQVMQVNMNDQNDQNDQNGILLVLFGYEREYIYLNAQAMLQSPHSLKKAGKEFQLIPITICQIEQI